MLLVGVLWIVAMTYICYRGIEVSANFQKALLSHRDRHAAGASPWSRSSGSAPGTTRPVSLHPSASWLNPFGMPFSAFASGLILMVFIYWGWDTALSVNEETKDPAKTPGRAAILSTVILLVTYAMVIFAAQAFAGIGTKGIGLANPAHVGDVISVLGTSVFGSGTFGTFLSHLLILMVLSSAAASTQTTILPTARTTLSMAAYKALPPSFAKIHPALPDPDRVHAGDGRHLDRAVRVDELLVRRQRDLRRGHRCGVYIAFYYGLTAFACVWYYRATLLSSARHLWVRGIIPLAGGLILWVLGGFSLWQDYDVATENSYTMFTVPGLHWQIGGVFVIAFMSALVGLIFFIYLRITQPAFFKKQTLTRATPTLVPDE